jgi:hypothetical protein
MVTPFDSRRAVAADLDERLRRLAVLEVRPTGVGHARTAVRQPGDLDVALGELDEHADTDADQGERGDGGLRFLAHRAQALDDEPRTLVQVLAATPA